VVVAVRRWRAVCRAGSQMSWSCQSRQITCDQARAEDLCGVGVAGAAGSGALVDIGRPGGVVSA
jgi:hypothetical protein